ncbi:hypothetical protein BLNAU_15184 [Blattamonas nauphoetae]|uniref:Uncharacterized protein n=1 Tax=Blattamonas nauphoetae TaxID=2049346 RepID=A0ABQ9XBI5_9EUKA|nr:hypothetical protein BLNAU_15184 [Blattamonas nauphoetae]
MKLQRIKQVNIEKYNRFTAGSCRRVGQYKPIYRSNDTLLIFFALRNLTELFKLVDAAASPPTKGTVFITKDIQAALKDFTSAYDSLPPQIPNFEQKTRPVKLFNKANYMYKSVPTSQSTNNFLERPIDLLFRPSTYSLFSHILFNSNGYTKTCFSLSPSPAIFHIVTGTPGIGKSALRMPLFTLTLSLGANEVKTARKGEPSFIFVNKNQINFDTKQIPCDYDEQSCQSDKLTSNGKAIVSINRKVRNPDNIIRDTFCYTYKVKMSLPWEGKEEDESYHPNHVFSSPTEIGEVTVPSIHYFPHFFKLFVNNKNQIENHLRGTTWHIVDDFTLDSYYIPPRDHVVLLTSHVKERWCHISGPKDVKAPILIYNVPTLLFPEMIHMFNAIPCPFEYNIDPNSMMMKSRESIHTQGMIPRDVFTPRIRNDIYRTIHPSSPQFDPVNWYTQHATLDASQNVQKQTTKTKNESTKLNLISLYDKHLGAINFADKHQKACLRAVENGLTLTQLRLIDQNTAPRTPVSFPKTKVSLCEMLNNALDIETITIPDAASFNRHETEAYHPQLDFLFQRCLVEDALTSLSPPNNADTEFDTNDDFVSGDSSEPWTRLEVVTSQLVPNHPPNAGFDSILLMFRYKKITRELHSLGVFFLKDATESNSDISDRDVQLMKRWCYILACLYRLKRVQMFPSFIFMTDSVNFPSFTPPNRNKLDVFIPMQNIWIAQFKAKEEIGVEDFGCRAITANTAPVLARFVDLPINHNPHAVRCSFCGSLVTESFPDHCCEGVSYSNPMISLNRDLLTVLDRSIKTGIHQWVDGFKLDYENDNWQYRAVKLAEQPYQSLEFDVPSVDITDHTLERQFMLPAVPDDSLGRINVDMENETDYLQNKRIQYESFWQSLNRKNPPAGLDGTLQKDENDLIKKINQCEDETEKSRLTCVLAKGLLLRSRLSLQQGDLETAKSFLVRSKQNMVLNDTAEMEYELMLASGGIPETPSDELKRIVANARKCFGVDWERWIQEDHDLPILLSPSFHILQRHLKEIQFHVTTLRSHLEMFEVEVPMTNESRNGIAKNTILQTLMDGLSLQMLIAHRTGNRDQVDYFQRELKSIKRIAVLIPLKTISTPFQSQEEQIEEFDIDIIMEAIGDILNTTRNHCDTWHALITEHQHILSSEPRHSQNLEATESTNEVRMIEGTASASGTPPHLRNVSHDILTNAPLFIDRIYAVIDTLYWKLQGADNEEMIRDLFKMIAQLSNFVTIANEIDRTLFGKQKRGDNVDSGLYNPPSTAEKRMCFLQTSVP